MKIAFIGTDGLPARYGGFETFVQEVAPEIAALGHEVLVIGSSIGRASKEKSISNVRVAYLPIKANGGASVLYDFLSFFRAIFWADAIIILGVSAGIFIPLFRLLISPQRLIINVDGLESRRNKWFGFKRSFLHLSERIAIRFAPKIVADNRGIADILQERFSRDSEIIAYGCDHVLTLPASESLQNVVAITGQSLGFALTIARIEPENNIDLMIDGFLKSSLDLYIIVGNFEGTDYGAELKRKYSSCTRLLLLNSIYDPKTLASLRATCAVYLHGHSVGGTNPSLVEMLPYRRPILAWDCTFNRATLFNSCGYFSSTTSLTESLESNIAEYTPSAWLSTHPDYQWRNIAKKYVQLIARKQ